ncbi:hypothetical protein [Lacinutrix sp. MedPE-SW]|uniref:hypothetical protein n=1 Tax=Lacinutrix sp. MedPE-SW TaxID=1860087 RepID=UPI000919581D|nr:hypothetical protein [Lacinutrix sp. MedPE-SW]OIQ16991.1 MAG: hypothetical protein BM549_13045 [Lacinutrix sp. MedPE-SW]
MGVIQYYDLDHAEIFIFDDFLIKQVKEGELISYKETEEFKSILKEHFNGKKLVYIGNRVNSFSINPMIYKEAEKIPNLIAVAIIPGSESMRANAEFEGQFYNKPYQIFDNLTQAIKWVRVIMKNENKKDDEKAM